MCGGRILFCGLALRGLTGRHAYVTTAVSVWFTVAYGGEETGTVLPEFEAAAYEFLNFARSQSLRKNCQFEL